MIMKDFDLTRQNWQRAKVQAECVLPSPEINMRCENCIIIMSSAGKRLRIAQLYIRTVIGQSVSMIINIKMYTFHQR